jgi:signal transduction histidine kinase
MNQEISKASANPKVMGEDLVNSLYMIKGIAENQLLTIRQEDSQEEQLDLAKRALSSTLKQASKVIEMIQYLRGLTAAPAKQDEICSTSVHDSLHQVLHAMSYEFPFRNITILKIIPHDLTPFPIARDHLDTLLFQLIYNARRSLKDGPGIITLEAQEYTYFNRENQPMLHYHLRVADTGAAIPPEELPHLFDPFFTSTAGNANHLGLYMVKKLVELNRGIIRVESTMKGTAFYLDFAA